MIRIGVDIVEIDRIRSVIDRRRARRLKVTELAVSLSHSRDHAVASVVGATSCESLGRADIY